MKTKLKRIIASVASSIILLSLTACGSGSNTYYESPAMNGSYDMAISEEYYKDDIAVMAPQSAAGSSTTNTVVEPNTIEGSDNNTTQEYLDSQKLIYSCDISIESKEFEESQKTLHELVKQYGGFISYDSVNDSANDWYYSSYNKTRGTLSENMTVRIPTKNYEKFVNGASTVGKVLNKSANVTNITRQYNDVETTIKALKVQETRLLEMLESCNDVSDMITVERRLSEVQTSLEKYQTQLNGYDMDIQYSTVSIYLREVVEFTTHVEEITFAQQFKEAIVDSAETFVEFLQDLSIALVYMFPYLVLCALVILIFGLIIRACIKSKNKSIQKKQNSANKEKKQKKNENEQNN